MTTSATRRPESREALLVAARAMFAEHGYDRTTMRAVAARASVDPALIYHYFPGGKRALLAETLTLPAPMAEMMTGLDIETDRLGCELLRRALQVWDGNQLVREQGVALIRIAVASRTAGQMLRPALLAFVEGMIGKALRDDNRELRAALVLAHVQGILLHRYVLVLPPLATASPDELVGTVGPVLQHYISGDLGRMDDPAG
jgi:AcrR family transcriptional regulator